MCLSWRKMKPCGIAQCIACHVDFCGQSALATPDRFLFAMPPFAPAECW
jgi:hypothetical protein